MKATYLVAALALALGACGDNIKHQSPDDAAVIPDTPVIDAPVDAPPQPVGGACLDRPTDLPRPPTGALDCDMLPPGFVAEAQ
jgi:hypothetical protein